ncbi:MAG: hypothetical protein LBN27_01295 [Prevotellaceae bacterium]|jgi:hypothetical protein|nr:hypothetical protein [Prevotellaceae bacterium]
MTDKPYNYNIVFTRPSTYYSTSKSNALVDIYKTDNNTYKIIFNNPTNRDICSIVTGLKFVKLDNGLYEYSGTILDMLDELNLTGRVSQIGSYTATVYSSQKLSNLSSRTFTTPKNENLIMIDAKWGYNDIVTYTIAFK